MNIDKITVALDFKDDIERQDLWRIISSIPEYVIKAPGDSTPCDLMILQVSDNDLSDVFSRIDSIVALHAAKYIFLATANLDTEMLLKALRAGVKEVMQLPAVEADITKALLDFRKNLIHDVAKMKDKVVKQGIILSLQGSKGGVGTTTLAVNIAATLLEQHPDKAVVLVDMNKLYGDIPLFLGARPIFNWIEVARNVNRLDATYLMSILARHSSGLHFLPAPPTLEGDDTITPAVIERVLTLLQTVFDFIVIDNGQSIDASSGQIFKHSHIVVLVTVLSLPCLVNVKKLLDMFLYSRYMPLDRLRVVATRYSKKSEITLKDAEKSINMKIFHAVVNDYYSSMSAINQGKIVSEVAPKSDLYKSIKELTEALFSVTKDNGRVGGLKSLLSGSKVFKS